MANTLQFTTVLDGDSFVVTAELTADSTLPKDIFIYENEGTTELNNFVGIVDMSQLTQYPRWTGTAVPVFSVPFVRSNQGIKRLLSLDDLPAFEQALTHDVKALLQEISAFEPIVDTITIT